MTVHARGATVRRDAGLYGYERALARVGLSPVAGVDEAGRGACAGPLVAAAATLPEGRRGIVPGLADSKLLTAKQREACYEQVLSRALAWSVVVVPAAWPAARVGHWTLLGRARAIENQTPLVACNTAGTHSRHTMGGASQVVDATGRVLAEAGPDEQVLSVDLDLEAVAALRESFPVLADRRL